MALVLAHLAFMLSPVICSSCAARVHPANRTTASTATMRTTVAIPATSMLEIRLLAMHHFWQQSSGGLDLRQVSWVRVVVKAMT
jgi:hypothetical protein